MDVWRVNHITLSDNTIELTRKIYITHLLIFIGISFLLFLMM